MMVANENGTLRELSIVDSSIDNNFLTLPSLIYAGAQSRDDSTFAVGGASGSVYIINTTDRSYSLFETHATNVSSNIISAQISMNSFWLAVGNDIGNMFMYARCCTGYLYIDTCVSICPDGTWLKKEETC